MVQMLNMLTHRNDSTAVIPPRELKKLVYGPDSVFARSPTAAQVAGMTHADVVEFLQKWERPDNAVFGMAGAITVIGLTLLLRCACAPVMVQESAVCTSAVT